jgi:hypothetical protein
MLIFLWILALGTGCDGTDACVTVPAGADSDGPDWTFEGIEGKFSDVAVYCFCSGGEVLECYVSSQAACEVESFDRVATAASPIVLGDVTLSSGQEQDLRETCVDG